MSELRPNCTRCDGIGRMTPHSAACSRCKGSGKEPRGVAPYQPPTAFAPPPRSRTPTDG